MNKLKQGDKVACVVGSYGDSCGTITKTLGGGIFEVKFERCACVITRHQESLVPWKQRPQRWEYDYGRHISKEERAIKGNYEKVMAACMGVRKEDVDCPEKKENGSYPTESRKCWWSCKLCNEAYRWSEHAEEDYMAPANAPHILLANA